jgi:hypothetical protein
MYGSPILSLVEVPSVWAPLLWPRRRFKVLLCELAVHPAAVIFYSTAYQTERVKLQDVGTVPPLTSTVRGSLPKCRLNVAFRLSKPS